MSVVEHRKPDARGYEKRMGVPTKDVRARHVFLRRSNASRRTGGIDVVAGSRGVSATRRVPESGRHGSGARPEGLF